ncbi:MAG TPA: cobyrinate a,c-diamide synthase [Desulfobacterales bacterium]
MPSARAIRGLVVAGPSSGCGKTTIALGLMAALRARGLPVYPFKIGPDFIDPGHHQRIGGVVSRNLDGWMLSKAYNRRSFLSHCGTSGIAVVEGVMGLFDGYDGKTESGSTAQMAKWLDLPVLLVVDARSMARSAAALVFGFERFDPQVSFLGVVFNRIGSPRHLQYLSEALAGAVDMPILGGIPRSAPVSIPERHLGLVMSEELDDDGRFVLELKALVETNLDVDRLIELLPERHSEAPTAEPAAGSAQKAVRIAVARDAAFCFYYQDNFDRLVENGAELVWFSALEDDRLPEDIHGIYFGGGYPELHAVRLAANQGLKNQVLESSRAGMPIYGECGGLMYLGKSLQDLEGRRHAMTGCLPLKTRMLERLRALGYRQVRLEADNLLGETGLVVRGHEFHYSEIIGGIEALNTTYRLQPRNGESFVREGYWRRRTLGSYVHLHFGSAPRVAANFVTHCRRYRDRRD